LGRLLDVCKPSQRKYDKALAAAMGSLTEAIVVDSRSTAVQCVSILRDHRLGFASFLPADALRLGDEAQLARTDDILRTLGHGYKLAKDLVVLNTLENENIDESNDREGAIRRALDLALEGTVVADDLKSARVLRYDQPPPGLIKVVTLSGAVVTAGAMTGGAPPRAQRAAVNSWRRADIERLDGERKQLMSELEAARRKRRALEDIDLPQLERKLAAQQALKAAQLHETNQREERQRVENERLIRAQNLYEAAQNSDEYAQLVIVATFADARLEELRQGSLSSAEKRILNPLAQRFDLDLDDLLGAAAARGLRRGYASYAANEIVTSQMQTARTKAKVRAQAEYEKRRLAELEAGIQARQQSHLPQLEATLNTIRSKYNQLEISCTEASETLTTVEEDEQAAIRKNDNDTRRAPLAEARQDAIDQLRAALQKKSQHEKVVREFDAKIKATMAQARLDHIRVPLQQNDDENEEFDLNAAEAELFSRGNDDDDSDEEEEDALQKRRRARRAELDKIEARAQKLAPNMKASERCEALADELKAADAIGKALRDAARSAAAIFEDIKQRRRTLFSSCLDSVASRLATLYAELTSSSRHPTGGAASLAPLDADEPYLAGLAFHATPPSKRFCDIHQLSGGERALASLALLFAIHDVHQAPFLLLDEVDANLDASNLHQLAAFAASRTHTQIVAVTHKEPFYVHAQFLVGVAKDVQSAASLAFSLDLAARFDNMNINDGDRSSPLANADAAGGAPSPTPSSSSSSSSKKSSRSSDDEDDDL